MCGSISKPCKNNKEVVINQRQPPPSSAFERHQIALEKERESVQVNFVSCAIGTRSALRTFAPKSSYGEIFFISPVELVHKVLTPKMKKKNGGHRLCFGENGRGKML